MSCRTEVAGGGPLRRPGRVSPAALPARARRRGRRRRLRGPRALARRLGRAGRARRGQDRARGPTRRARPRRSSRPTCRSSTAASTSRATIPSAPTSMLARLRGDVPAGDEPGDESTGALPALGPDPRRRAARWSAASPTGSARATSPSATAHLEEWARRALRRRVRRAPLGDAGPDPERQAPLRRVGRGRSRAGDDRDRDAQWGRRWGTAAARDARATVPSGATTPSMPRSTRCGCTRSPPPLRSPRGPRHVGFRFFRDRLRSAAQQTRSRPARAPSSATACTSELSFATTTASFTSARRAART